MDQVGIRVVLLLGIDGACSKRMSALFVKSLLCAYFKMIERM